MNSIPEQRVNISRKETLFLRKINEQYQDSPEFEEAYRLAVKLARESFKKIEAIMEKEEIETAKKTKS